MRVKINHSFLRYLPFGLFLLLLYFTQIVNYDYIKGEDNFFIELVLFFVSILYFYGIFILAAIVILYVNIQIIDYLLLKIDNNILSFALYTIYLLAIYVLYILIIYNGQYDLSLAEWYSSSTLIIAKNLNLRWIYLAMFLFQYFIELYVKRIKNKKI